MSFLPISMEDMRQRGWKQADIIIVSGDAYVDHPSFGPAIIGRVLEAAGYNVAILAQPDWKSDVDFMRLGRPRLFFGVTAGNMDSMVNHYTAMRKLRHDDAYSPDRKTGLRPDRPSIIYTNIIKRLYKQCPVVLGGIEASLRRVAHYDYWQDKVRASVLSDSKADVLVYGMAEKAIVNIARQLDSGKDVRELQDIPGTVVFSATSPDEISESVVLPEDTKCSDKHTFLEMNRLFFSNQQSAVIYQKNGGRWLRHNPPVTAFNTDELDSIYALPYQNAPHPVYAGAVIPAWEQIKDSITAHRGCYGGCHFCAIASHQGRAIQSRSQQSILAEVQGIVRRDRELGKKKTTISDIGGPTANMYASFCKLGFPASCKRQSCLYPQICPNLVFDHDIQLDLLAEAGKQPGVGHVFVASGIRHDMAVKSRNYISAMAKSYAGGRLKLAPENTERKILELMGKPAIGTYEQFCKVFMEECAKAGLKRQVIPYLIIGHPGSTVEDAAQMRKWLIKNSIRVEQVQEFTPTPMTISTCMYFTGMNYLTGETIHIAKPSEIRRQKELILWHIYSRSKA